MVHEQISCVDEYSAVKAAEGVSVSGGPGKHQVSEGVNTGSYEKSRNMCELKLFRVNDKCDKEGLNTNFISVLFRELHCML